MSICDKTISEIRQLLLKGEVTPLEVAEAFIKRIEETDDALHSFITVTKEQALEQARKQQNEWDKYKDYPLAGIPGAIKDNISTAGIRTTCGSHMLENYVPPFNATVVERLKRSGSLFVGKTNMDEFAMGSSTEHSFFGPTANPWDLNRVPGGSSGGSAAAVAAGQALYALGTDTGGSIRQPAAFCGVVGIRPTYGLVSRYGAVAFASSLDQIGPITRTVADCALVLEVISGHDPLDSTSHPNADTNFTAALHPEVKGLRIGVPREYFDVDGIESGVRAQVEKAIALLEEAGAEVKEISLPHTHYALPVYYIIAPAEASSNLARFDGVRFGHRSENSRDLDELFSRTRSEGFGAEVKRRIMLGTYTLSAGYYDAYYKKAQQVRTLVAEDFSRAFAEVDVICTPTTPTVAFERGDKLDNPYAMYLSDIMNIPAALAGLPVVSVPCGQSNGLPVGMQIIGPAFADARVLQVAYAYEQRSDFQRMRPNIAGRCGQ